MFVGFDGFGVNRKSIKCALRGVLSILKNDKGNRVSYFLHDCTRIRKIIYTL